MKLSLVGRFALALFASLTLGLSITGCGGGTVAYLWVIGQQYNEIAGFKVDDFTGNLTQINHQPFASGGTNPVSIVVKPGGRYVYVLNQGTPVAGAATTQHYTGGNVAVFSVGGDGILAFQQSYVTQGFDGQWLQFDSTGTFLYVLDKYSPSGNGNGAITAYSVDNSTGRLTLVPNTQSVANGQAASYYFEVGSPSQVLPGPFMTKTSGSCLFVATPNYILPFQFSNGQLQTVTNGGVAISGNISSIGGNASFLTVTDTKNNQVSLYQIGSGCSLTITAGGVQSLSTYGTGTPVYTLIDNSNTYLYILNQSNTNALIPFSSVSAFKIVPSATNELSPLTGGPYGVGSGPVCMVEDPTSQYLYISNHNDGTISGFVFDSAHGYLTPLSRGATFQATGQLQCMAISGAIG